MKRFFIIVSIVSVFAFCVKAKSENKEKFKYGVWITAKANKSDRDYIKEFKKYKDAGINELLINTLTDPKLLSHLVSLAKSSGMKVHAWIMAMNRPNDSIALKHPEWYAVSREGKSCHNVRPYVDYYQWLCPTRKESREHVLKLVEGLAKVDGIESVHLDYIRFCDIFLPIGLLPKYNLVQNTELPQFDFCYCDACVEQFKKEHHRDPRKLEHPEIDIEWKQFRLNRVKSVVGDAYKIAHKYGKILSAAVFPYPEMAGHMVRQRWDKWNIDIVYPMIYNHFYNEGTDWVGFATRQGVQDLKGKKTQLCTGIYVPPLSVKELTEAVRQAKENGAVGVSFFDGAALSKEKLEAIKNFANK